MGGEDAERGVGAARDTRSGAGRESGAAPAPWAIGAPLKSRGEAERGEREQPGGVGAGVSDDVTTGEGQNRGRLGTVNAAGVGEGARCAAGAPGVGEGERAECGAVLTGGVGDARRDGGVGTGPGLEASPTQTPLPTGPSLRAGGRPGIGSERRRELRRGGGGGGGKSRSGAPSASRACSARRAVMRSWAACGTSRGTCLMCKFAHSCVIVSV